MINEKDVVIVGPGEFVSLYLEGLAGAGFYAEGAQFEHIAQLAGGTRSAVEPDDGGDIFELVLRGILLAIEEESQGGVAFLNGEVSRHGNSAVVIGSASFVKIKFVADCG